MEPTWNMPRTNSSDRFCMFVDALGFCPLMHPVRAPEVLGGAIIFFQHVTFVDTVERSYGRG